MKPPKNTIQWIAPHLSEGEIKAMYEMVLKEVVGPDIFPVGETLALETKQVYATYWWTTRNQLRAEQRATLNKLFGMDNK